MRTQLWLPFAHEILDSQSLLNYQSFFMLKMKKIRQLNNVFPLSLKNSNRGYALKIHLLINSALNHHIFYVSYIFRNHSI